MYLLIIYIEFANQLPTVIDSMHSEQDDNITISDVKLKWCSYRSSNVHLAFFQLTCDGRTIEHRFFIETERQRNVIANS